ncbi:spermatogenesis-associated protein 33 [Perognathus longimembris pacificus]|uniref:spermatogenesis-associated protein 33 n=1 Tax=Perognathus longimembris pacificus TaxID=214514 RepID=UPI0020193D68|nr:spermatogenesis-associated protein 33 [Perognathus longimembris pacificus]
MGLSKSKPKQRKGKEEKNGLAYPVPTSKNKWMKKQAQGAKQADSLPPGVGPAKDSWPASSSEEKPEIKQSSRKNTITPQIIITRASDESIVSYSSTGSEEQRTIRECAEWGPYRRHRNPSTIAAYLPDKE